MKVVKEEDSGSGTCMGSVVGSRVCGGEKKNCEPVKQDDPSTLGSGLDWGPLDVLELLSPPWAHEAQWDVDLSREVGQACGHVRASMYVGLCLWGV